jgi:hypothetical protein
MNKSKSPTMPYKGLMPYSDSKEDARFFFGREQKKQIIVANLIASRLTLLYGPSGVGKSSVIRAGAAFHLRQQAREVIDQGRVPKFIVVVFDSWRDKDPLASLVKSLQDALEASLPAGFLTTQLSPKNLLEGIAGLTVSGNADKSKPAVDLLVILDQFEEYFLYHGNEDGDGTFAVEFPRLVNNSRLGINFLISMRDDSTTKLDRFKGRIPNLFANRLSIEHLDTAAAREAIVRPRKEYNSLQVGNRHEGIDPEEVEKVLAQDGGQIGIESRLVEEILKEVKTGQLSLGQAGGGSIKGSETDSEDDIPIETPFLQLVLTRLWEEEVPKGSKLLRLATLERLGGAESIVKSHLDKVMNKLTRSEQDTAALIFYQLVTPSGSKIAHSVDDLSFFSKLPRQQISETLGKIADTSDRILRSVPVPALERDQSPEPRYEIFHDVLGSAVLDWRSRHEQKQKQKRIATEAKKQRDDELALAKVQAAEQERQLKVALEQAEQSRQRAEEQRQLAEALELKAKAEQQKLETEQKRVYEHLKSAKRLRWLVAALLLLTVVSFGVTAYALKKRSAANTFAEESKSQRILAETYRQDGLQARHDAEEYRQKGEAAQTAADGEREKNKKLSADAKIREDKANKAVLAAQIALGNLNREKMLTKQQSEMRAKTDEAQRAERHGDKIGAIYRYESLLSDLTNLKDEHGQANTHYSIGYIYKLMSEADEEEESLNPFDVQESKEDRQKRYRVQSQSHLTTAAGIYEKLKAKPEAADMLSTIAGLYETEDPPRAIEYYKKALPLYSGNDLSGEIFTVKKLAEMISSNDDSDKPLTETQGDEAIRYYRQLIPLYSRLKERSFFDEGQAQAQAKLVDTYELISVIELNLNRKADALRNLKEAAKIVSVEKDPSGTPTLLRRIAGIHAALGQKTEALDYYLQAFKLTRDLPFVDPLTQRPLNLRRIRATTAITIGNLYSQLAQNDKALEYYEQARELAAPPYFGVREGAPITDLSKRQYQKVEADALSLIAMLKLEARDEAQAIDAYSKGLALYVAIKNDPDQIKVLRALEKIYEAKQDTQRAASFFQRAQELETKKGSEPPP